jgi:uncharacterized protein YybS (DUF2232 family)
MGVRGPVTAGTGQAADHRIGGVAGAGVLAALLFCSLVFLPALSLVALVSPVPLLVLRLRHGLPTGLLAVALAAALVSAAASAGAGLAFTLALVAPALLVAESLARGRGMLRGCAWGFALLVAQTGLALLFSSEAMAERSLAPFEHLRSAAFISELNTSGVPEETVREFVEQVGAARDAMAVVFPAAWIIAAAMVVIANAGLLRLYLRRRDPGWLEEGEFERLRLPLALVPVFILAGASVVLPLARPAAYNVLLVVAFFFALQGLTVVGFYARRLAAPPLLRLLVLLLVLANPWAPQILALLGLFDNWFDFRRWAEPPREKV